MPHHANKFLGGNDVQQQKGKGIQSKNAYMLVYMSKSYLHHLNGKLIFC